MTEHADQLREAFETHENMTPDPSAVYARVEELSRKYKRRRLSAQVAGGAVLSAGLVAGVIGIQTVIPGKPDSNVAIVAPAAAPTTSAAPGAATATDEEAFEAYFDAGYDYLDAAELAKLWQMDQGEPGAVKIAAGKKLLAGETLPFAATPDDNNAPEELPSSPEDQARFAAFFESGFVYDDAVKLAKIWKLNKDDIGAVKLEAGKRLLAGETLPVKPKPANVAAGLETKRVNAFFEAGYDVADAVKLAKIWKQKTAYEAKVEGGKRLLAGKTLPIEP